MTIYSNFFSLHPFFASKIYNNTFKTKIAIEKFVFIFKIHAFEWIAYSCDQKLMLGA